jgi:hypothetical protein
MEARGFTTAYEQAGLKAEFHIDSFTVKLTRRIS